MKTERVSDEWIDEIRHLYWKVMTSDSIVTRLFKALEAERSYTKKLEERLEEVDDPTQKSIH